VKPSSTSPFADGKGRKSQRGAFPPCRPRVIRWLMAAQASGAPPAEAPTIEALAGSVALHRLVAWTEEKSRAAQIDVVRA
jgi:hypothetical protein